MIDLSPTHLATVRRILAERVPNCTALAFGSRVKGTAKPYSDLDVAIRGYAKLSLQALGELREAFEGSDLPVRVDFVDWHATSAELQKAIEACCEVVQSANPGVS